MLHKDGVLNSQQDVQGESGKIYMLGHVWDPIGLAWVKETQASSGGGTSDATAANQTLEITQLTAINANTDSLEASFSTLNAKDFATTAKQDTGNASLSSIDSKFTTLNAKDFSTAANQTAHSTLYGAVNEAAPASDTASSGLNGRLQRIAQRLTSLIAQIPAALGQTTSANSMSVTLSSDYGGMNSMLDKHTSGSIVASDTTTEFRLACNGIARGTIQIFGTWGGSNVVEASTLASPTTAAADWTALPIFNAAGSAVLTAAVANGFYEFYPSGYTYIRVRRSVATSGTFQFECNLSAQAGGFAFSRNVNNFAVAAQITTGTASIGTVQPGNTANTTAWLVRPVDSSNADLTTTKGTQTSRVVGVQDLKDSGRTHIIFYATNVAAGTTTTETAITLTKASGTGATSSASSFVVTSGKRYRITNISFATRGHSTATIQTTNFSVRLNTAGAVTTSSTPIILQSRSATPATASAWDRVYHDTNEGLEILGDGTLQFGITANATYVTNAPTWDVYIGGYEY